MTLAADHTVDRLVHSILEAMETGNMRAIEQIVLGYRGSICEWQLLEDVQIRRLVPELRAMYAEYEAAAERELRTHVLHEPAATMAGSEPVERTFAYVPLEVAAAGMTQGSRYCHVGIGPFPETLLAMRQALPHVSLTGIDVDEEALAYGRELVQFIMPRSGISFLHAAGDAVDYQGFTHIHVAVLVRPEYDVVECICKTADRGATIMLRTAEGLGALLYESLTEDTDRLLAAHGFSRVQTVRGHAIMSTAIYRR